MECTKYYKLQERNGQKPKTRKKQKAQLLKQQSKQQTANSENSENRKTAKSKFVVLSALNQSIYLVSWIGQSLYTGYWRIHKLEYSTFLGLRLMLAVLKRDYGGKKKKKEERISAVRILLLWLWFIGVETNNKILLNWFVREKKTKEIK